MIHTELTRRLSRSCAIAKELIKGAQERQKKFYDCHTKDAKITVGDRLMVHMPGEQQIKEHKLVHPFHGPYRVLMFTPNNAVVILVDTPRDYSIFLSLNRVHLCYPEQTEETWTGSRNQCRRKGKKKTLLKDCEEHSITTNSY